MRSLALAFPLTLAALFVAAGCASTRPPAYPPDAPRAELLLVNQAAVPVSYVYISPCRADSRGEDQLGDDTLEPGEQTTFRLTPGCWNLQATFEDGQEAEQQEVALTPGGSHTWAVTR